MIVAVFVAIMASVISLSTEHADATQQLPRSDAGTYQMACLTNKYAQPAKCFVMDTRTAEIVRELRP